MSKRDGARARLLAAARQLLGLGDVATPITVVLSAGRAVVVEDGAPAGRPDPGSLPPAQRAVYEALADGPLTARALARRLRRKYNSNLRGLLGKMVRAGLIRKEAGRYARQGDTRPDDSHP